MQSVISKKFPVSVDRLNCFENLTIIRGSTFVAWELAGVAGPAGWPGLAGWPGWLAWRKTTKDEIDTKHITNAL